MAQPTGLSGRAEMVKISCTPPSGLPSVFLMNRASRPGPFAVMNEGTVFPGATVEALASWGLMAGVHPPRAAGLLQHAPESRVKRGPTPAAQPIPPANSA